MMSNKVQQQRCATRAAAATKTADAYAILYQQQGNNIKSNNGKQQQLAADDNGGKPGSLRNIVKRIRWLTGSSSNGTDRKKLTRRLSGLPANDVHVSNAEHYVHQLWK